MFLVQCCYDSAAACGCRGAVINNFAFRPPKPASYDFIQTNVLYNQTIISQCSEEVKDQENKLNQSNIQLQNANNISTIASTNLLVYRFVINRKILNDSYQIDENILNILGYKILTARNTLLPICQYFYLFNQDPIEKRYLIIFSHANSTDLGYMHKTLVDLVLISKVDVLAYDYAGYGVSDEDQTTDIKVLNDIQTIYKFATNELKYQWNNIILYGQSIGSGPSTFLASLQEYPIAGLILHSGLASGLRVTLKDLRVTPNNDFFPNIDLIQYINCPLFLIHGTNDMLIPIQQIQDLYQKTKQQYQPWFVEGGEHNNIETNQKFKNEYFKKISKFIRSIKIENDVYSKQQLYNKNKAEIWGQEFQHIYRDLQIDIQKKIKQNLSILVSIESDRRTQQDVSFIYQFTPYDLQQNDELKTSNEVSFEN